MTRSTDAAPCAAALESFLAAPASAGWRELAPFRDGRAQTVCGRIDARIAAGERIAPAPERIFATLAETPFKSVRVLVLGQDPYPTPGDANGLAFSYVGAGRVPRSLANIFRELADDLGPVAGARVRGGDLTSWARQGVLLLNSALTAAEGPGGAGSHLKLGWGDVTEAIVEGVAGTSPHLAALLWGGPAQGKRHLIDERRHLVIASAHPSPLSARRGFFGSRPFSRTNRWLAEQGLQPIIW
jgi:uracil-DNA glycosylase